MTQIGQILFDRVPEAGASGRRDVDLMSRVSNLGLPSTIPMPTYRNRVEIEVDACEPRLYNMSKFASFIVCKHSLLFPVITFIDL